jgi:hypothetical protein
MGTNAPQETTSATGTATGRRLHVALSGGGHRATLYALGALEYLVDAGLARDVVAVASVSGGSIANGRAAQEVDLRTVTAADFRARVTLPLATRIARGEGTVRTWLFLVTEVLLGLVLLVCCLPCSLPLDNAWRVGVFFAAFVPFVWLLPRRGALHDHALSRFWLHDAQDRPTLLRDTHGAVDHVFCATDLEGQHHVYFAQRFVWSHDHGRGVPGAVRLSTVVQASAAFPAGSRRGCAEVDGVHGAGPCGGDRGPDEVPCSPTEACTTTGGAVGGRLRGPDATEVVPIDLTRHAARPDRPAPSACSS